MTKKKFTKDNSVWYKSEYEFQQIDGIDFLVQKKGGDKNEYDPLEYELPKKRPQVPDEQLEIAPHIALSRINPENYNDVLQFANTWGLLGLVDTKKYSDMDNLSKILNNSDLAFRFHTADELYKDRKRRQGERNREPIIVFQEAVRTYQEIAQKLSLYCEDNGLIQGFRSFKKQNEFMTDVIRREEITSEVTKVDKQKAEEMFNKQGQILIPFLELNEMLTDVHPQIFADTTNHSISRGWRFKSLLSAIYLRMALDLDQGEKIIHCRWRKCNKLFIPNREDNQHCSDGCKNNDKTDRANQRNWLKEAVREFSSQPVSKVERTFKLLIQEGYSGKVTILNEIRKRLNGQD